MALDSTSDALKTAESNLYWKKRNNHDQPNVVEEYMYVIKILFLKLKIFTML